MTICTQGEVRVALGLTGTFSDADRAIMTLAIQKTDAKVRNVLRYDPERKVHTNRLYPVTNARPLESRGTWDVTGSRAILHLPGGANSLQLTHLPVRQITSLEEDRSAYAGTATGAFPETLTEGLDWYTDWDVQSLASDGVASNDGLAISGLVYRIGSHWPVRARSVRVTYTAGYTSDELRGLAGEVDGTGIHEAAIEIAAATFKMWKAIGVSGTAGLTAGTIKSEKMESYSYTLADGASGGISDVTGMKTQVPTSAAIALSEYINVGNLFA